MQDIVFRIFNNIGLFELVFIFCFFVAYIVRRIYFFFTKRSVTKSEKNF